MRAKEKKLPHRESGAAASFSLSINFKKCVLASPRGLTPAGGVKVSREAARGPSGGFRGQPPRKRRLLDRDAVARRAERVNCTSLKINFEKSTLHRSTSAIHPSGFACAHPPPLNGEATRFFASCTFSTASSRAPAGARLLVSPENYLSTSAPCSASTVSVVPGIGSRAMISRATSVSTRDWMKRFSGRAP